MGQISEATLARLGFYVLLAGTGGYFFMAFYFPRFEEARRDIDQELTVAEGMLVRLSGFCVNYGIVLMPMLLIATIGVGVWKAKVVRGGRRVGGCE